jgi:hypothetical protein
MTEIEIERTNIAIWLRCEAFEQRFDPGTVALLARIARAIQVGVDPHISLADMETDYESDPDIAEQI